MAVGNLSLPSQLLTSCDSGFFHCLALWTNDVTNGWFWVLVLVGAVITSGLATAGLPGITFKRAFGTATILGLLGSLWLGVLGLMSWWITSLFIILGLIGMAVMFIGER